MNLSTSIFSRVTLKDKVFLARQLSTMLGSGLAIDQCFKVIMSQTHKPVLRNIYQAIVYDIEQGNSLSYAISRHPKAFDPVFIAIVRSGESSGKLDVVLSQLADRLELSSEFNSKVKAALMYPAFLLIMMIFIVILMMVFIVPQLKTVFEESNVSLPVTTRAIMALSKFTTTYWWIEVIVAVFLILFFYFFFRSSRGGSIWDRLKIKLPILKDLYTEIYMARFCRTMSMLMNSGVPIMETLAISADVIQNRLYTQSLKSVTAQVERGIPISVPLQKDKLFMPIVPEMIMVGEQTGKMGMILTKLAEFFEKEVDVRIKGLASLIEPVVIVIMGIGVGFLVFSIIYPIYSIAQTGF